MNGNAATTAGIHAGLDWLLSDYDGDGSDVRVFHFSSHGTQAEDQNNDEWERKDEVIVTADHGNCETMIDPETGGPHTAHTTNLVPVALVGGPEGAELHSGRLADLAPTLLALMNLPKPPEMTGESLIS